LCSARARARRSSVEGGAEYAFRHLLVRDVAYGQIPRAARAVKHLAAAEWAQALGRAEDHAEMLASHYSRALEYSRAAGREDGELVTRARQALRDAGERAASLQAWSAAAGFYEEALGLWPETDSEFAAVQFRCGEARFHRDGTGLDLVQAGVDGLAASAEPEVAGQAAVIAARIHWLVGDLDHDNVYGELALRLVGDRQDSAARVGALTRLVARQGFDGRFEAVIEQANKVLPDAERLGLFAEQVRLLNLRADSKVALGDDEGFADFAQAIALASEMRLYEQLQSTLNNKSAREIDLGRLEEAQKTLLELEANLGRYSTDHEVRWVREIDSEMAYTGGRWHEALPILDRFLAESEAGAPHYLDSVVHNTRALIRRATGDRHGALEDSEKALESARRTGEAQLVGLATVGRAAALLDEGRTAEALLLAREALDLENLVLNDFMVVEAAWVMLDLGLTKAYLAWLTRKSGFAWARAAELICAGDLHGAAEVLERIRLRPGEAQARLRVAKALVEEGRRGEADAELRRSLAFWREVGAVRYVREGEALLAASA
jgi:tetratricopeptide (TPR) repeat protein